MNNSYNDNLHKGSIGKLYEYGRGLRQVSTEAEELVWQNLRSRKLNGLKFRRQHPLDKFIADFYCHEKKLVIEIDGSVHDDKDQIEADGGRTYELNELGIVVIRFRNEEVLKNISTVLETIRRIAFAIN